LGLTAHRFDRLLAPERSEELRKLLHSKFPEHVDAIDQVLGASSNGQKTPTRENLVDFADRMFGPERGVEVAIPPRGILPDRAPPDFILSDYDQ
jgi:hypothetical protein